MTVTQQTEENKDMLGKIKPHCSYCGSEDIYGMSRIVGYFSKINNWNESKKGELLARQKGNYRV